MTVLKLERHPVNPDHREDLHRLVEDLLHQMREAPGVLWADAASSADDGGLLLLSEWRTAADVDAWESGPEALGFQDRIDPWLTGEVTHRRFAAEP